MSLKLASSAGGLVERARRARRRRADTPRISAIAVSEPERSLSQQDALALLGLRGDPFAEGIFQRCGVSRRSLTLTESSLSRNLQGRTAETEDRVFEQAVRA